MTGVERIAIERLRQILGKGWTPEHDDAHEDGQLSLAAECYAAVASAQIRGASADEFTIEIVNAEMGWPWDDEFWNPSADPVRNLEKAGALIAAELDRLERVPGEAGE